MTLRDTLRTPRGMTITAFTLATVLSSLIAGGSSTIIEQRSRSMVRVGLEASGHGWAKVDADGLQVLVSGLAPSEAERFRALTLAGSIIDNSRVIDLTEVDKPAAFEPPTFSLEILRNDDGISLIGLVPAAIDRKALLDRIRKIAGEASVTDMLETVSYPAPRGWQEAFDFGIGSLSTLPRSKISIAAGKVAIVALTDSPADKTRVETEINRRKPGAITVETNISAPRPVITPFTLRFAAGSTGARFEACSADTERAKARIEAAAVAAGITEDIGCEIGMGVPSPRWGEAVALGIKVTAGLGDAVLTFTDADVSLVASESVEQRAFDNAVGELESNLPDVFSLKSELRKAAVSAGPSGGPEFSASLQEGQVQLRGRLTDAQLREAVETMARARFGASAVLGATRLDESLPAGWSLRAMAAIEALDELTEGSVVVTPAQIAVTGVSGNSGASSAVARILAQRLGKSTEVALAVRYDKRLDPKLALPTGAQCVERVTAVLDKTKISFEPASSILAAEGAVVVDALAKALKDCDAFKIEVAGHTDAQGSEQGNLVLSQERADAVVRALSERRVKVANLSAKGYGESAPVAENETEEGREANRRIEFVLRDAKPAEAPAEPAPAVEAPVTAPTAAPTEAPVAAPVAPQETAAPAETPAATPAPTPATPAVTLQPAGPDTKRPKARPAQ